MNAERCASEVNEVRMLAKRAAVTQALRAQRPCEVCRKCNRPMYACGMHSPNDSVEWPVKADGIRRLMPARTAGQTPTYVTALNSRPPHLTRRPHLVPNDIPYKAPVDALVEEALHEAVATRRSFACSGNSMTCSRLTDGNPARNSSMESPASR